MTKRGVFARNELFIATLEPRLIPALAVRVTMPTYKNIVNSKEIFLNKSNQLGLTITLDFASFVFLSFQQKGSATR